MNDNVKKLNLINPMNNVNTEQGQPQVKLGAKAVVLLMYK